MISFKQNRKSFFMAKKKSNFQNFCKTFGFVAVTLALLNGIKQQKGHVHACILSVSKNKNQYPPGTEVE